MYRFFTTFKKHGFKLWLANLLGLITTFILYFIVMFFSIIIAAGFLISSFIDANGIEFDPILMAQPDFPYQLGEMIVEGGLILLLFLLVMLAISVLIISFSIGGGIGITAEAIANNRSPISSYFKYGLKSLGKMFGYLFLSTILFVFFSLALELLFGYSASGTPSAEGLLLSGFLSLLFLLVYCAITLNAPVIAIVEQTGVFKSFSLSFRLLKNSFGKVLVTILYLIGLTFLFFLIPLLFMPDAYLEPYDVSDPYYYSDPPALASGSDLGFFVFSLVLLPLYLALTYLIIVYRYFKYMRPFLRPDGGFHGGGGYPQQPYPAPQQPNQPPFVYRPNQNPYSQPPNYSSPNPQPPNQQPPFYS